MSRQRLRPSIYEADLQNVNTVMAGKVRSVDSVLKGLHDIEEIASKSGQNNIRIDMPEDTAIHILNNKRKELASIEVKKKINITIVPNNSIVELDGKNLEQENKSSI